MRSSRIAVQSAAVALFIGLAAIVTAWGFEVIGGYLPCKLCYQERIPYYVGLPVLAVALAQARARPALFRALCVLGAAIFAVGFAMGTYHAGAEWGFWPGPSDCGGGAAPTANARDLMSQMRSTRLVSCTEATFRVLGLSFAGWNAAASLAVAGLAAFAASRPRP